MRQNDRFWLILILLLAFLLRTYGLADVAINNDEIYDYNRWIGVSFRAIMVDDLVLNNQSLAHILARTALLLLGDNLFALRWPAVCLSVLGVVLLYKVAGLLFGHRAGLVSALLLALSPYAIFFAHTFRGYSGVISLPLLLYLLALLAARTHRWRYWLALGIAAPLTMYTHLFTALALLNVLFLLLLAGFQSHRPGAGRPLAVGRLAWSLAMTGLAGLVLYAPVWSRAITGLSVTGSLAVGELLWLQRPQVPASIWNDLLWFNWLEKGSFGRPGSYLLLALVLAGLVAGLRRRRLETLIVLGWALLPFLAVTLLQQLLPGFWARPQYLGYTLPPLLVLAALALAPLPDYARSRRWLLAGFTLLLVISLGGFWYLTLREFYRNYAGGNWLAVGNFLQQQTGPNDLVICQPYDHAWRDVDIDAENNCTRSLNYRRKAGVAMIAPASISHALVYGGLPEANAGVINRLGRVWLVVWDVPETAPLPAAEGLAVTEFNGFGRSLVLQADGQPTYVGNLARALDALRATARSPEQQFIYSLMIAPLAAASGQNDLAGAALAEAAGLLPDHPDSRPKLARTEQLVRSLSKLSVQHPLQANFDGQIMLVGYSLDSEPVKSGSTLDLTLFWQALQPVANDYSVFLHVRDRTGRTVAQFDYQPYDGNYPTRLWQPGQWLADPQQLPVPPDFPPGEYDLLVGFYDPGSLARLPLANDQSGENALRLASLRVQ